MSEEQAPYDPNPDVGLPQLLPCPYCGEPSEVVQLVTGRFCGRCTSCTVTGPDESSREDAILFWNELTFKQ